MSCPQLRKFKTTRQFFWNFFEIDLGAFRYSLDTLARGRWNYISAQILSWVILAPTTTSTCSWTLNVQVPIKYLNLCTSAPPCVTSDMVPAMVLPIVRVLFTILLNHHSKAHPMIHPSRAVTNTSKAGLALPYGPSVDIKQFQTTGKVSWSAITCQWALYTLWTLLFYFCNRYYSWSPNAFDTELEFVPMLWGPESVDQFTTTINQTISQNHVAAVLGMNESVFIIFLLWSSDACHSDQTKQINLI